MSFAYESNRYRFTRSIMIFLAALLASGCASTSGPKESRLSGSIVGWASAFWTNEPVGPLSVHLEPLGLTTNTDTSGRWSFDNIPSGTYSITFSKDGFAALWLNGFEHVGGGTTYLPTIQQVNVITVPTRVDSIVYGHDLDGNAGYVIYGEHVLNFAADEDSLQLATDPLNAQIFNVTNQSSDSAGDFVVPDYAIRNAMPGIRQGDSFFVVCDGGPERDAYVPSDPPVSGRWGCQPFKTPYPILRLQYKGN